MYKKYILVLNCGSSSIKFSVVDLADYTHKIHGTISNINTNKCHISYAIMDELDGYKVNNGDYHSSLLEIIRLIKSNTDIFKNIAVIGHRVVHGGDLFIYPTIIDKKKLLLMKSLEKFAPLHIPAAIIGIEQCMLAMPDKDNIAVFDTSFHATIPKINRIIPIDKNIAEEYGIKKYGFHGLSHQYINFSLSETLANKKLNIISCHLGSGCSITAIKKGESVDTTMSFTPLSGICMATRSGDIDPAIIQFLMKKMRIDIDTIITILNNKSGLFGVSNLSRDFKELEQLYYENNKDAVIAIEVFCYQIAKSIASFMVPLIQCDAIVFTGGIGENSALARHLIIKNLAVFKILLCNKLNKNHGDKNGLITVAESLINCYVVNTNEDIMLANQIDKYILCSANNRKQ